nr:hypothetical protein [Nitrolancea hollandica]
MERATIRWDKLRIGALGPRAGMPPPHAFLQQDAPDLAPLHRDPLLLSCSDERIQAPLGFLLRLHGCQLVTQANRLAGRYRARQSENSSSLLLGQPRLPSWSRTVAHQCPRR